MMKTIKQTVVVLLIVSVLLVGFSVHASALVIHENGFGFSVNTSKHEAIIVSYDGDETSVTLPAYYRDYPVTTIDRNAFSGNTAITEVTFSNTNTTVDEYAFMNCTSLERVTIPENVISFGDRVFAGCTSLTTVTMLSDIVSMPTNMFSGCSSLENVTINDTIAEFGYGCFNGCSALTDLSFVSNGVMLQSYAFNGTGASSVVLSEPLLAIPDYAFTNCPDLAYVTIPESVVLIQPHAFDVEHITIRCYKDSAAHMFAVENNIPFELLTRVVLGDVNGDGYVNINDVTTIQRHLAEIETLEEDAVLAADVDGSGSVEVIDATNMQRFLAEYQVDYPIGVSYTIIQ